LALPALMAATRTFPQVFLVHNQRRGGNAVGREDGGGAGRRIGHDESKVGAAALLEPRFCGAKAKAER
jgi:hypothetical protein